MPRVGGVRVGEKLRDVKRPACFQRQTGACRSCGLAVAVSQPCRGHEEPVGAINPNSQTDVQRMKRSTPIAGRVSSGRRTNVKLQPPDLDRGRRATSNPPVRSALPAKDQRQLRFSSSTLVGDRGRANHPPVVPVQQGSRTQVSMVGNLGKSLTVQSLSTSRDRQKRACEAPLQDCRQIVHKTSLATLRTRRSATATTVRRSGAAEAPAFSALSACRRAPSAAS